MPSCQAGIHWPATRTRRPSAWRHSKRPRTRIRAAQTFDRWTFFGRGNPSKTHDHLNPAAISLPVPHNARRPGPIGSGLLVADAFRGGSHPSQTVVWHRSALPWVPAAVSRDPPSPARISPSLQRFWQQRHLGPEPGRSRACPRIGSPARPTACQVPHAETAMLLAGHLSRCG